LEQLLPVEEVLSEGVPGASKGHLECLQVLENNWADLASKTNQGATSQMSSEELEIIHSIPTLRPSELSLIPGPQNSRTPILRPSELSLMHCNLNDSMNIQDMWEEVSGTVKGLTDIDQMEDIWAHDGNYCSFLLDLYQVQEKPILDFKRMAGDGFVMDTFFRKVTQELHKANPELIVDVESDDCDDVFEDFCDDECDSESFDLSSYGYLQLSYDENLVNSWIEKINARHIKDKNHMMGLLAYNEMKGGIDLRDRRGFRRALELLIEESNSAALVRNTSALVKAVKSILASKEHGYDDAFVESIFEAMHYWKNHDASKFHDSSNELMTKRLESGLSEPRQWTDTKSARCSEGKNHDTSKFQDSSNDLMTKRLESGMAEARQWKDTKSDRCSQWKNHDNSEQLQKSLNDVKTKPSKFGSVQSRQGADMKNSKCLESKNEDLRDVCALYHDAINIHPNQKEELGIDSSNEQKCSQVLPNLHERSHTLQEKVVHFFLDHYLKTMFAMLSLIFTIEALKQLNSTTSSTDTETFYRNFAIIGFLSTIGFGFFYNKIRQRVHKLEQKPSLQAENVFAEGSQQQVVINIWAYEGDLERIDEILKQVSHHATLQFKSQSTPANNDLESFDASAIKNWIIENARAMPIRADSKEMFGMDKEMYESLDAIPKIPL